MAPLKKVVLTVESSEDHSIQEQMAKMMVKMKALAQPAATVNQALEDMKETQVELTARITELQRENQFLKETHKKMQYDPCNPEIEKNEMYEEVHRPEVEQPR